MITLELELLEDLTEELELLDEKFNQKILIPKLRNAIREVRQARKYPSNYTESMIEDDMRGYYSNIRNITLYDYNTIGAEGQSSVGENGVSIVFVDRNKLFNGILPLSGINRMRSKSR